MLISRPVAATGALLALGVVAALSVADVSPPDPKPASAAADEFSAGRAQAHIERFATRAHPTGSANSVEVVAYLEQALRGLGLTTEVQEAVGVHDAHEGESVALARVRNVVATLPGTASTGRVFLVAHHDSIQVGPGANDDGAGVAAILEVARVLATGPRPRNDVVFLLTDAEEICMCGAAAFLASHPLAKGRGVVLNLEARGSSGPAVMFETSERNAELIGVFAKAAPHPIGMSFSAEVYRRLPNDTDLTLFHERGFAGLNAAHIDGGSAYHRPQDNPAAVDQKSLQHHGDNALGLARAFADKDLATVEASGDATYFPVPGMLVRYPGWLVWPLAVLAAAAVAVLAWFARRQGVVSGRRLAAGFGAALLPILVAPVAAQLLWAVVAAIRPGYSQLLEPYRPLWYRLAILAVTAAVLLGWYAWLRRRIGAEALAIGALGWLAGLGLLLAAAVPGGSYVAALPALAVALAGITALAYPRPAAQLAALTVGAAVGVLVLLPTVVTMFPALGLAKGGAAALFAMLLGLAMLPVIEVALPRGPGRWLASAPGAGATLLAVALAATGLVVDRFDAAHPTGSSLMYALDADTGQARWASRETRPGRWTDQYVNGTARMDGDFPLLVHAEEELSTGPAQASPLPAPKLTVLSDQRSGDLRTLRMRIQPQRPVRLLAFYVDRAGGTVQRAVVAGQQLPANGTVSGHHSDDGRWTFSVQFHAPPAEGVEVELVLRAGGGGSVPIRVIDGSDGLDSLPGFVPRPAGVGITGSHVSELVAVARTYPV
ncbi:MAG TPA: M20/M25/M40 family metallo-hydrolase [Micromonosporaceae bacterium]|nr:M20/M25/M40 family metallo-hydrolase [Micromonosporaceae bacterium]